MTSWTSRKSKPDTDIYLETFDLGELLQDVVGIIRRPVEKNANTFVISGTEHLGEMHADLIKVRETLFNLLSNAAKFTESGIVSLEAQREERGDLGAWITFRIQPTPGSGWTPAR